MLKRIHFNHSKIKEKIKILNDFLLLLLSFLFIATIVFKFHIFRTNQELIEYDDKIIKLKKEEEQLQIQYLVLTSPERLNNLYIELKNNHLKQSDILTKTQIKNFNILYSYMFNKYKGNLKQSFAKK